MIYGRKRIDAINRYLDYCERLLWNCVDMSTYLCILEFIRANRLNMPHYEYFEYLPLEIALFFGIERYYYCQLKLNMNHDPVGSIEKSHIYVVSLIRPKNI